MPLSSDLISQFTKATNDSKSDKSDIALRGTVVMYDERPYVKLDGSDELTPVARTVEVSEGDRVEVSIKNHTAIVTGNTSDPSIGVKRAGDLETSISQTAEEIRLEAKNMADELTASINLTASEIRNEVSDEVNKLNSSITQNADNITSVVKKVNTNEGDIETLETRITQNADNITSVVKNQYEFSEFKQTVEGFSFMGKGGTVKISGGDLNLTGAISFSDLSDSDDVQADINTANSNASSAKTTANNALYQSQIANNNAAEAITTVSGFTITEGTKTYIDGEMIYSDSIYANAIHLGGQMAVYRTMYNNVVGGYLGYCSGFNSNKGIGIMNTVNSGQCICTDQAARLSFAGDSSVVTSEDGVFIDGATLIYLAINGSYKIVTDDSYFRPAVINDSPATMYLGSSSAPWSAVYASTGSVSTSDRNQKNSIEDLPEKYVAMFDLLQPKRYKLNNGTSDRYHVGYIAQEVEEAMTSVGIDSKEFGGFVKDKDGNGNDVYLLRYSEFDAIRDAKIKQLESRIESLEGLVAQLLNKQ